MEWDPNTPSVKLKQGAPNKIGSLYEVKSLWKGQEQLLEYKITEYEEMRKIVVKGENFITSAVDEILFEEKHPGTNVTYLSNIELRHLFKVATPFILKDLQKLAQTAESGFR